MATEAEKQKLHATRARLKAAGADWTIAADGERIGLFAACPEDGVIEPVATLDERIPFECQEFLLHAASDLYFVLSLLDRCQAFCIANIPKPPPTLNYAANCAIMCKSDQAFRQYLIECHDLQDATDAERIKTRVRSIIRVSSLSELSTDPDAISRWRDLLMSFRAWKQGHAA